MATGRVLGRGRVLGTARNLSTATAPEPSGQSSNGRPLHNRNLSGLSPSESSISLSSQVSTTGVATNGTADTQDLSSKVVLEQNGQAAATASGRLVCPICNEEMMTLLQLNRHIDDIHANLEVVEQDEVKNWFKSQMKKAKKFQPLVVFNQKFKGLDVFESNDTVESVKPSQPAITSGTSTPEPARVLDPDEVVTRSHWQRPAYQDNCSDPMCGKRLGGTVGSVNCRKCGKLFCEEHTMYQIKLSRSATHEPIRGIWCRVCETCYKSRDGYNDQKGFERSHTDEFLKHRRKVVDRNYLEVSRLEKRMTKLTQLVAQSISTPETGLSNSFWGLGSGKAQQRAVEQTVVTWQDDTEVSKCPFCMQEFTSYTFRRHHCRLCGRVVCGDPRTDCSTTITLDVETPSEVFEKEPGRTKVDVRTCKECQHTLFSKADFRAELEHKPPDQRSYENLYQFERGIRLLQPKFQKLLAILQDPESPPVISHIHEATKVRKRLTDSFVQYEAAARRIRDLPSDSPTQLRLQKAVYQQATNFLHIHMLPLKALPKILKHASPHGRKAGTTQGKTSALSSIRFNDQLEHGSQGSVTSSALESMEAEEKGLRERLIVLEEQRFIVGEMVADARKRRRFDEERSLASNVDELAKEIDRINGQLEQLDFGAVYASPLPTPMEVS